MSNEESPLSILKMTIVVVIIASVLFFIYYLFAEAVTGIMNGLNKIPIWLGIPLIIATVYVLKQMFGNKK